MTFEKIIFDQYEKIAEMGMGDYFKLKKATIPVSFKERIRIIEIFKFSFIQNKKLSNRFKTSKPNMDYHGFLICKPIYSEDLLLFLKHHSNIFSDKIDIIKK